MQIWHIMIYHDISHIYITSNPKKDMERDADVYDLGVSPWGPKLTGQPPASAEIGRWLSWGKELPHSVSVNVSELLCFLSLSDFVLGILISFWQWVQWISRPSWNESCKFWNCDFWIILKLFWLWNMWKLDAAGSMHHPEVAAQLWVPVLANRHPPVKSIL